MHGGRSVVHTHGGVQGDKTVVHTETGVQYSCTHNTEVSLRGQGDINMGRVVGASCRHWEMINMTLNEL